MGNMVNTLQPPPEMLRQGGINDALAALRNFHRIAVAEANRAKEIEDDVIVQLNGLRSDLNGKIKEIKGLSGDFKNNVDRERENTRRMVESLTGAIRATEHDPASASGKGDPFIMKLGVERQVDKQIQEENYLHKVRDLMCCQAVGSNKTAHRHTLTWRTPDVNSSPSLLVRFKRLIMPTRPYSTRKSTPHMRSLMNCGLVQLQCPEIMNGLHSSRITRHS